MLVDDRRVPQAEDHQHRHHEECEEDEAGSDERHRDDQADRHQRHGRRPARFRRIDDVPAIELPEREQVECRGEHAKPAGKDNRVHVHRRASRHGPEHQLDAGLGEQRLAEVVKRDVRWDRDDVRKAQPQEESGHQDQEPGDRSGDADIEERRPIWERLPDANQGSQRTGQDDRHRDEIRERRVHVVLAAQQVMPHLVCAENR